MVFDETLHRCIDSYLRYCPRSYDTIYNLPPEAKEKHNILHKQVFLVCLRTATHKESKVLYFFLILIYLIIFLIYHLSQWRMHRA